MPIQATQLADLVATTLRDLGRPNFTEIARDLQKYTAIREIYKQNRVVLTSGVGVQFDVMVARRNSAANVGLGAPDNVDIADTMVQAQVDWRNSTANYGFEGREIDMNRSPARIVDLIRARRINTMIDLAELMEANFWGPPVASTDSVTPWGANTWLVKNASEGFNGGAPSGYTTIGLNPTTYPRWKNYTAQYTVVAKDDLVRKVRKAMRLTHFEPPIDESIPTFDSGRDYKLYSNLGLIMGVEELAESQNENLGNDVASKDNNAILCRCPLIWVPKLEADTTNPIYGLNWGWIKTFVLQGWWLKETNVPIYPGQHTMSAHFLDCTYQVVFHNRREHFVIATGTTYPS